MQRKQPMRTTTKEKQPQQQRKKQLPQENKEDKDNGIIRGDIIST
jgi:hypothetical protein